MAARISRNTSGGAESCPKVKAVCISLDMESSQIFWKAAAWSALIRCSAVVSALSFMLLIRPAPRCESPRFAGTTPAVFLRVGCLAPFHRHGHRLAAPDAQGVHADAAAPLFK